MPDRLFSDADLAALYDLFSARRSDLDFYLGLVMSARAVLDVGCGTGAPLHQARESGHTGWERPQTSRSTLRFLDKDSLSSFLSDAGLAIEEQFGDWDRQPRPRRVPRSSPSPNEVESPRLD